MACSFLDSWLCESGITTTTQLNPLLCTFTVLVRGAAVYEADRYQSRDGRRGLARCPQKKQHLQMLEPARDLVSNS